MQDIRAILATLREGTTLTPPASGRAAFSSAMKNIAPRGGALRFSNHAYSLDLGNPYLMSNKAYRDSLIGANILRKATQLAVDVTATRAQPPPKGSTVNINT